MRRLLRESTAGSTDLHRQGTTRPTPRAQGTQSWEVALLRTSGEQSLGAVVANVTSVVTASHSFVTLSEVIGCDTLYVVVRKLGGCT